MSDFSVGSYVYYLGVLVNLVGIYRVLGKGIIQTKVVKVMDIIAISCWGFLGLVPFINATLGIIISLAILSEAFLNIDNKVVFNFNKKEN